MRRTILSTALIATSLASSAGAATLDRERWRHRVLLLFAPDASSPPLTEQKRVAAPGMAVRDLILIEVTGDTVRGANDRAADLRRRFGVREGAFRALLIGKDGGVKIDAPAPIPARRLFETIDAMPMRRDEMRRP